MPQRRRLAGDLFTVARIAGVPARVVSLSANVGDADFVADAPQQNESGK